MDKIKAGIIGYGHVGRRRAEIIKNHSKYSLKGICDTEKPKEDKKNCPFYNDYNSLLNENIDAVFICTPNKFTPEIAVNALNKKKHIFCEKPPGRTVDDIKKIINAEKKNPELKVKFGFNHRYHNGIIEAKSIADSGRLGKILWMRGIYGKSGGLDFENRPNNSIAYLSDQLVAVGKQVEIAQSRNQISEEKGDELIGKLLIGNKVLSGTVTSFIDIKECADSKNKLECADSILKSVEEGLQ